MFSDLRTIKYDRGKIENFQKGEHSRNEEN